jgi:hypothetical protein
MRKQWLKDCGGGESVGGGLIETIILSSFHRRSTALFSLFLLFVGLLFIFFQPLQQLLIISLCISTNND